MKFKFNLDESLFDDDIDRDTFFTRDSDVNDLEFDDDFSEYEDEHTTENVLPGPAAGADTPWPAPGCGACPAPGRPGPPPCPRR